MALTRRWRAAIECALMLGVVYPASAQAAGFSTPNVGTARSGPARQDPAAGWWNPAMLSGIDRPTLLIGGGLLVGDVRYQRDRRAIYQRADSFDFAEPIEPENIDPSKTGLAEEVRARPLSPVPTAFYAHPLGEDFVAGLGLHVPYAALLSFDPDGAQRWALQEATIISVYLTPSISWQVLDRLSLGAGASYVFGLLSLSKVQDFAALGDVGRALSNPPIDQANDFGPEAPPSVRELDVMARQVTIRRATAHSGTFNLGAAFQATDSLLLGLSYQHSVPMTFLGEFTLDMDDDFFTQDLAGQGLEYDPTVTGQASVAFPLPRSMWLGGDWQLSETFGLNLIVGYVTWSQIEQFDVRLESDQLAQPELGLPATANLAIPRRWRDTVAVEASTRWRFASRWEAWLTGGYNSSASPDSTVDVASPDGDRLIGNLGASWFKREGFILHTDLELQRILPRTVVASDHDLGNGTYRLTLLHAGVHAEWAW